jgi:hypothetical protein
VRTFLGAVPLSAAGVVVTVLLAWSLSGPLARALRTRRGLAALLLFGFGLVASATLVPTAAALEGYPSEGVCDTSRIGIASMRELTTVNVTSLNVLLFVPLGVAVGLLPWSRAAAITALAAFSLTFAVETFQLLLPVLGRGCQTADMVDNLLGLAIGLIVGSAARLIAPRRYLERPRSLNERSEPD